MWLIEDPGITLKRNKDAISIEMVRVDIILCNIVSITSSGSF